MLMADDDEVFEVTAISEQLDLEIKYAHQVKKLLSTHTIQDQRGICAFDGLHLLLLFLIKVGRLCYLCWDSPDRQLRRHILCFWHILGKSNYYLIFCT